MDARLLPGGHWGKGKKGTKTQEHARRRSEQERTRPSERAASREVGIRPFRGRKIAVRVPCRNFNLKLSNSRAHTQGRTNVRFPVESRARIPMVSHIDVYPGDPTGRKSAKWARSSTRSSEWNGQIEKLRVTGARCRREHVYKHDDETIGDETFGTRR